MVEEKFILASLEDEESKELAQVISSKTARKILNLLSNKDMSETEISKKLRLPLTTIHYNIKQLINAKLIEAKKFKWSEKGKKIRYYKLSNKLIIISPKSQENFLNKIKSITPVAIAGILTSGLIYLYTGFSSKVGSLPKKSIQESSDLLRAQTTEILVSSPNYALWFLVGVIFSIVFYLIISYWRSKK